MGSDGRIFESKLSGVTGSAPCFKLVGIWGITAGETHVKDVE